MPRKLRSDYRRPVTEKCIREISEGTLSRYGETMYANLNSGLLEEYFDYENGLGEKGRSGGEWSLKSMIPAFIIGLLFVPISMFAGLKTGSMASGLFYVVYIVCILLKQDDRQTNMATALATSITSAGAGFIFVFPAIYILRSEGLLPEMGISGVIAAVVLSAICGFIGLLYVQFVRHRWIIEDPLPFPGLQANIKLMEIPHFLSRGVRDKAKRSVKWLATSTAASLAFTFLREFPLKGKTAFGRLFGHSRLYNSGNFVFASGRYFQIDFFLSPMMVGTGWFLGLKNSLLVVGGSLLTWFAVNPLLITLKWTYWDSASGSYLCAADTFSAYANLARYIAIGAILGAGITSLIKMIGKIKPSLDRHLFPAWLLAMFSVLLVASGFALFWWMGLPIHIAIIMPLLIFLLYTLLSLIALKAQGEVSMLPVSSMAFVAILATVGVARAFPSFLGPAVIAALVGVTAFGVGVGNSGGAMTSLKIGLYAGNRPKSVMLTQFFGIVPGVIVAAIFGVALSTAMVNGQIIVAAPQANASAFLTRMFINGHVDYLLFGIGGAIGIAVELLTGRGVSFALGMYFPLSLSLPFLAGGLSRGIFEKRCKTKREEKINTSYLVISGLIIGEALVGTIVAIYAIMAIG
ncbi:MAG: hypothetical protein CVT48_00090 [Thermoplasmata archaeon HGW-Thermoplasmata-1]|nr:MAG: hypothetical protein CVT48_00090 [Thermoplasmata archaeon HGW-Thermoplasmata-1]